jgi:hypothetical protein
VLSQSCCFRKKGTVLHSRLYHLVSGWALRQHAIKRHCDLNLAPHTVIQSFRSASLRRLTVHCDSHSSRTIAIAFSASFFVKLRLLSSSRTAAHISRLATMTLPMSFLFAGCGRKTLPLLKAVGRMQAAKSATSPVKEVLRPLASAVSAITASPPPSPGRSQWLHLSQANGYEGHTFQAAVG